MREKEQKERDEKEEKEKKEQDARRDLEIQRLHEALERQSRHVESLTRRLNDFYLKEAGQKGQCEGKDAVLGAEDDRDQTQ